MILIDIHKNGGPLYKQIYNELKKKILERTFNSHEKLPSKRMLAEQLDVSINTITNAYEQLLVEGYIYTIERSGYYIEDIAQFTKKTEVSTNIPADLKEHEQTRDDWLSLSHMTADISLFPFKEWLKHQKEAITKHQHALTEITHPQGPYVVRETIAQLIALTRGVDCEPEQIVISSGTQPLMQQLMEMQKVNKTIAMEDPGYSRLHSLFSRLHLRVLPMHLDDKGIDIEQVEDSDANFVFVTPSHQFPTGTIMPVSRRIQLLNWAAQKEDRFIIEDDYDSEFTYKTDNIPSLQSLDKHQRVIYLGTFSKTLLPSFRISYMVLPPDLLRIYRNTYADLIQYSNTINLFTLHYFITSGAYARHVKRMNNHYENKRAHLISHLKRRFKSTIVIKDIPAGLHFFATCTTNKTYEMIEKRAKEIKLEIYTLRRFTLEDKEEMNDQINLVIGFANITKDEIPEAVDRLYTIIHT